MILRAGSFCDQPRVLRQRERNYRSERGALRRRHIEVYGDHAVDLLEYKRTWVTGAQLGECTDRFHHDLSAGNADVVADDRAADGHFDQRRIGGDGVMEPLIAATTSSWLNIADGVLALADEPTIVRA